MLWNWYTIDACFLSESWHITSRGMFAGSCIGVILLVMSLEFLRRAAVEYESYITHNACAPAARAPAVQSDSISEGSDGKDATPPTAPTSIRPTVVQAGIRAILHMFQFAVAYIVMLLAMYFNGYIIICIFIGAGLGYFIFSGFKPIPIASIR